MTDIVQRSQSSTNVDTASSTYTGTKPSGLTVGDTMVVVVGTITGVTLTPPTPVSGTWTQKFIESTNANVRLGAWERIADANDVAASTFAWALSASAKGFIWMAAYQNVDATTPIEATSSGTVTSVGTTGSQSVTSLTANNWLLSFAIGRHAFAAARSMATSDGSDTSHYAHGSTAGSGFDYAAGIWDSGRDLSAGSETRTFTTNTGTENAISWGFLVLKPSAAAVLKGHVYYAAVKAPGVTVALKGRVFYAALKTTAASGPSLTGRVYYAAVRAPATSVIGKTGLYAAVGGTMRRMTIYAAVAGQLE